MVRVRVRVRVMVMARRAVARIWVLAWIRVLARVKLRARFSVSVDPLNACDACEGCHRG